MLFGRLIFPSFPSPCACVSVLFCPLFCFCKVGRNERINYAKGLLQREFLPHVGIGAGTEAKKVGGGDDGREEDTAQPVSVTTRVVARNMKHVFCFPLQ